MVAAILVIAGWGLAQVPAGDLTFVEQRATVQVQADPSAANWQKLGLTRYLQNRYEPAIKAFREAVRKDGNLWTSQLFLGISLYRTNQFREALISLERSDLLAPAAAQGRDDVDYWLGATHIALKRPLRGLQSLERLLKRVPRHAEALQLATETYAETASLLWNHVADRAFDSAAGQEVHGYALESEGNREAAMQAFRRSRSIAPKRPGPRVALGRLLLSGGNIVEARQVLAEELQLDPTPVEAHLYLGLLALRENRAGEAIAPLQRAMTWMPQNEEPALALCQAYLATGDAGRAVAAARLAVAADAGSHAAHELLLAALGGTGDAPGLKAEKQRWVERETPR